MNNTLRTIFCFLLIATASAVKAQLSILTDISLLRNHSPKQRFLAAGQTVAANFYVDKKNAIYALGCYYVNGDYSNKLTTTALQPATTPQQINYTVNSKWLYRQVSFGIKHYFKGEYNTETTWSIYGNAGFGLLFNSVQNTYSQAIDTTVYAAKEPLPGKGNFKRLTFDVSLGAEMPIGTDVYLYAESRASLPASDYPSPYLISNKDVPLATCLSVGLRVLIQ